MLNLINDIKVSVLNINNDIKNIAENYRKEILTNEINDRVESLELMSNKEFMDSYNKSKEQIKKREFVNWNAL